MRYLNGIDKADSGHKFEALNSTQLFYILYATEPEPFYAMARAINLLFYCNNCYFFGKIFQSIWI